MSTVTTTSTLLEGLTSRDLRNLISEAVELAFAARDHATPQKQDGGQLLTRKEAASYLRISVPSLQRHTRDRRIDCVRMGRRVLFRREDLDACLQRNAISDDDHTPLRLRRTPRRRNDRPTSRMGR
ncbi:MAG: helix-turn-helix domain-containing protein ['Candidatus Kapabacteria' thiocyanatum]|nr:helix-turn-helix domain-containing protein ['Candidatus Kapabacteria' thiocyanatum]